MAGGLQRSQEAKDIDDEIASIHVDPVHSDADHQIWTLSVEFVHVV